MKSSYTCHRGRWKYQIAGRPTTSPTTGHSSATRSRQGTKANHHSYPARGSSLATTSATTGRD
eukprot:8630523-Pyramimonas_sp.AAC.1